MKIRADFVTNSSSVSFLLTIKKQMAEQMIEQAGDSGKVQLIKLIQKKMEAEGNRIIVNGEELCAMQVTTRPKEIKEVLIEYFKEGNKFLDWKLPDFKNQDLSHYTDEELWAIVCTLLHKGKISDLQVVGATPIGGKQRVY